MSVLLHEVATSYRTILPRGGGGAVNSFKSVYKMSGDPCSAQRVNKMFYFLISRAGPPKVLLLNKSPYIACFSSCNFGLRVQKSSALTPSRNESH